MGMTVVATRGNLRLVDDGRGMGHVEGRKEQRPLDSFLKWGYWEPIGAVTAAGTPIPGEEPLIASYERVLSESARRTARNYRRAMRQLTAAEQPDLDRVLDEAHLTAAQKKALKAAREKIARDAAVAQAFQFGISFAVQSPYLHELIDKHAGKQAERIVAGSRKLVAGVIRQARDEGWSVPQTAQALREKLDGVKKWQATMLARTDLIAMNNAGSFAAAMALGEARPLYKRWINADDEKVRPSHVEAMNQVVLIDQPFQVGDASLMFPGDPSGPDEEVINCRCTQVYANDPSEFRDHLWGQTAAAWNEADHPRDPGGEGGGEFIEKGAVESFDPVPKLMMHGLGAKKRRELAAVEDEIRALPIPENNLSHDYGITPNEEMPRAGSMEFYRSSGGRYHLSGPMIDGVILRDTADEIIQAAQEQLAVSLETGEQNWKSRLRGHTMTKRNSPEVFALLEKAQAYNDSSPAWTGFAEKWGLVEQPIVLKEEGMKRMGKDVLTNGFYDPDNDNVFFSGDFMKIGIDLHNNPESVLSKLDLVGPTYPGSPGSTTADHLIRHEYAHKAYARWSPRQRAEFLAMVPSNKDMLRELSGYAAASEEYYGGRTFGDGVFPWQGEVFAEAVASVTQPQYDREKWAPWVREMGDWILKQEPE